MNNSETIIMGEESTSISQERKAELEKLGRARLRRMSDLFLAVNQKINMTDIKPVDLSPLDGASLEEREFFDRFERLLVWVKTVSADARERHEQIQNAIDTIGRFTSEAIMAESFLRVINRYPIVMTSKDFLEQRQKGVESYFTKDGGPIGASAYEIFFLAFDHFMALLEQDPSAPNPLTAIREQYQVENTGSQYILERWNEVNEMGFYVLKGGTKSDVMTKAEFNAFLAREQELDIDDIVKTNFEGWDINLEKGLQADRMSIHGIKWNPITGKAKSIKKWQAAMILRKLYPDPSNIGDLLKEFRDLLIAICQQIETDFRVHIRFISPEDWDKPYITRRKLYEMGFYSIKRRADTFYREAVGSDIAVIQDRWEQPEAGYYDRPDPLLYQDASLESFVDNSSGRVRKIDAAKFALTDGYYYLKGLNAALDLIIKIHDLAGFAAFKVDRVIHDINRNWGYVRSDVEVLYRTIRNLPRDDKLRVEKLRIIKDHFLVRRLDRIEIPQLNIQRAAKMIRSFDAFQPRYSHEIYGLLFNSMKGSKP